MILSNCIYYWSGIDDEKSSGSAYKNKCFSAKMKIFLEGAGTLHRFYPSLSDKFNTYQNVLLEPHTRFPSEDLHVHCKYHTNFLS
jgi:hypothetical protein